MRRKKIFGLAISLLLVYFLLSPLVAWPLYNWILFMQADKRIRNVDEALQLIELGCHSKKRDVEFLTKSGTKIRGWYFELPNTKRVFLVSYGRGGNMFKRLNVARILLQSGGSVLLYDYQGYGLSEGSPTIDGVCEDVVAAYDFLVKNEHRSGKDIIGFGESFGSGVTGYLASHRKVAGAILHCGYSSLLRASRDTLPWLRLYPDASFPKEMLDNVAVFKSTHPPLLIIHGTNDRTLSFSNAVDLFRDSIEPKSLLAIKGGGHGAFGDAPTFFATINSFLSKNDL